MAFVDSNSTMAQVEDAFEDTAQYDVGGGLVMAQEHLVACRVLLRRLSQTMKRGDLEVQKRIESIEQEMVAVRKWVVANTAPTTATAGRGAVRYPDFSGFRE